MFLRFVQYITDPKRGDYRSDNSALVRQLEDAWEKVDELERLLAEANQRINFLIGENRQLVTNNAKIIEPLKMKLAGVETELTKVKLAGHLPR